MYTGVVRPEKNFDAPENFFTVEMLTTGEQCFDGPSAMDINRLFVKMVVSCGSYLKITGDVQRLNFDEV